MKILSENRVSPWKGHARLAYMISIFGVLQFLLLTFVAAFLYPGGYDYFSYYFSDLGAVVAKNGELNTLSSTLFSVTLTLIALALVPFWLIARSSFTESRLERVLSKLGSALGLMSSPFMIGVALFPIDTQLNNHFFMFLIFFPLFTVASLLYSIAIILNRRYPNLFGLVGLALFILSLLVLADPVAAHVPFLQKILIYGYFIWVLIFISFVWHRARKRQSILRA